MPGELRALRLQIAPRPLEIARALAELDPAVCLLHTARPGDDRWAGHSFVAVLADATSAEIDPLERDERPLPRSAPWSFVPRWIGLLPYEAFRSLERPAWSRADTRPPPALAAPHWIRHRAVVCVDHADGSVHAVSAEPDLLAPIRDLLCRDPIAPPRLDALVEDAEPLARHVERVAAARELILRGDLYQVNLARPLRLAARGTGRELGAQERIELYARLTAAAPSPLASCLVGPGGVAVASTSPELLLAATVGDDGSLEDLVTVPIKGSRPRGTDALADDALAAELDADPKERAELTMIVDVERNDLGRVAAPGTVRVAAPPHVVTHRTIHHRQATVIARVRADASRADVLSAMVPSGSVTGAPKVRAMEVIADLEGRRRGLYTGAIGAVAHDGSIVLAMAIRTATMQPSGEGEYLAGGGIVADSDPVREGEETGWKALQLQRVVAPM